MGEVGKLVRLPGSLSGRYSPNVALAVRQQVASASPAPGGGAGFSSKSNLATGRALPSPSPARNRAPFAAASSDVEWARPPRWSRIARTTREAGSETAVMVSSEALPRESKHASWPWVAGIEWMRDLLEKTAASGGMARWYVVGGARAARVEPIDRRMLSLLPT